MSPEGSDTSTGPRMRIDVVTIFPDYLTPLELSLPGKAQESGLLEVEVHDLRRWTTDRHRTVDDTPYGGGAGMVMRPEPWGEALDHCLPADGDAVLVVPTPSGERFTQRVAEELAGERHLVFACGRYEGIDQRVLDEAADRARVREVSLGDYVLNGGEVAALAVTEAVVRLLPGFMGNPESLVEESHSDGLLEYPTYTKPQVWRGREVPEVLRSGDHARIARWRREQALARTAARRPDLLPAVHAVPVEDLGALELRTAVPADAGELWTLLLACGAASGGDVAAESLAALREEVAAGGTYVVRADGRLVASVRARVRGSAYVIDRLLVAPDLADRGLGTWLLGQARGRAPAGVERTVPGAGIDPREWRRSRR